MTDAVKNLSAMTVFALDIHLWTGRKKLKPEDLGLKTDAEMQRVVSLGAKKILDPAEIRIFNTLRERARRMCAAAGLPFLDAFAVPNDKAVELKKDLEVLRVEFNAARDVFLGNYEDLLRRWQSDNPEFRRALEKAVTPASVVANQLRFGYGTFEVQAESLGGDAPEIAEALGDSLFDEVVKSARDFWVTRIDQKDEMHRKGLRALTRLRDKVDSLSFLDDRCGNIVAAIDEVVTSLPKTGPIQNRDFLLISALVSQMRSKSNFESLLDQVRVAQQGGLIVPDPDSWAMGPGGKTTDIPESAGAEEEEEVVLRPTGTDWAW